MKNMKLGILACGALGVVAMLMEFELFKMLLGHLFDDKAMGLTWLAAFVVPLVLGIMGLTKPPFKAWMAGVSLAAFGLFFIRTEMWSGLPHIGDMPTFMKLTMIADVLGIVFSVLALAKPEDKA